MTMQPRPNNPIEKRKQDVRKHSRNAVISVVGGVGGGLLLAWMTTADWFFLMLGLVVAVVGGAYNWMQIQKIVNHKDQY
ncbi:hypothetical protein [uncultured Corynebacterium sp.]|uniref:hypothetical protein n=1 Tax=uncultured Corynebacterium sp. TaxID=159447 RepID=UPI0025E292C3|nr:hypothetical protein [uncultured Corynebacterium sp.]